MTGHEPPAMSASSEATCAERACTRAAEPGAPVRLCEQHLAVAAEWSGREHGVVDLLPAPCVACGSRLGVHYPSGWLCATCEWRFGDAPDGELPPPRVDVVYYIRLGDRLKIGTSSNPRQRLARLWHDEVLAFERGGREVEQRRHLEFAEHRLGTSEWFGTCPELDAHARALGAGRVDPWAEYARWRSEALALRG